MGRALSVRWRCPLEARRSMHESRKEKEGGKADPNPSSASA